jgi:hypothetical protein
LLDASYGKNMCPYTAILYSEHLIAMNVWGRFFFYAKENVLNKKNGKIENNSSGFIYKQKLFFRFIGELMYLA